MDQYVESLVEAKFLTTLAVDEGFWKMGIDPTDYEKTAFIAHNGLVEFNVLATLHKACMLS